MKIGDIITITIIIISNFVATVAEYGPNLWPL